MYPWFIFTHSGYLTLLVFPFFGLQWKILIYNEQGWYQSLSEWPGTFVSIFILSYSLSPLRLHSLTDNPSKVFPLYQIINFQIYLYKENSDALFMSSFIHSMPSLQWSVITSCSSSSAKQGCNQHSCVAVRWKVHVYLSMCILHIFVEGTHPVDPISWIKWPYRFISAKAHMMDSPTPIFPLFIETCINLCENT